MTCRQLLLRRPRQRHRQKSFRQVGGIRSSPRRSLPSSGRRRPPSQPPDRSPINHSPNRIHCSDFSDSWVSPLGNRPSLRRRRPRSPIPTSPARRCRRIWMRWTSACWRRCVNLRRVLAFAIPQQQRHPVKSLTQPSPVGRPSRHLPKPSSPRRRQGLANRSARGQPLPILLRHRHPPH